MARAQSCVVNGNETGGQFNCSIEYSIEFSRTVGHPVKLNRKVNRICNRAIELTPWFLQLTQNLSLNNPITEQLRLTYPMGTALTPSPSKPFSGLL